MGYRTLPSDGHAGTKARRPVLILQHVPWEEPGMIGHALSALHTRTATIVNESDPTLPNAQELAGLVVMGGPMNADDVAQYPGLAAERRLLAEAVALEVPTLGVCLGAQLLARALGATITRGRHREVGWAPVFVRDEDDPLIGNFADGAPVLHWHTDAFELPRGATALASSEITPVQAFRIGVAWALQFHIEVTAALVARWLAISEMQAEAQAALGDDWQNQLAKQTTEHAGHLREVAQVGLEAFARLAAARANE